MKFNVKIAVTTEMLDSSQHNKHGGGKFVKRAEPLAALVQLAPKLIDSFGSHVRIEPFSPCSQRGPTISKSMFLNAALGVSGCEGDF